MKEKPKPRRINYLKTFLQVLGVFFLVLIIAATAYINTPYRATKEANKELESATIQKINHQKFYSFIGSNPDSSKTFLIYPGGRVEAEAYAGLCSELAKISKGCIIEQMVFNFAVLPHVDLETVINKTFLKNTEVTVIGHSLGGPFLARDLLKTDLDKNNIKNLVLLGSYSDVDISDLDINVYSLIGENDKLIGDSLEENIQNLPKDTTFFEIPGGNHSNWGDYGKQKGDGESSIVNFEQRKFLIDIFEK